MMGLWLCKDFIRVERYNNLIEDVYGGQYYYRSMLIFANCQQFDLTANRNNIRSDQEEFDLAINRIKIFLNDIKNDTATIGYFEAKKREDEQKDKERQNEKEIVKREGIRKELEQRLNVYKGRTDIDAPNITNAPIKEPESEAETALLLQAMISSKHPGIDFIIGEYKTSHGTDILVEYKNKGIPSFAWAEIVVTLENLFSWLHPPEGIHKIICWELGKVREIMTLGDGKEAKLIKKENGRYHLDIGIDSIEVYVLREIIRED